MGNMGPDTLADVLQQPITLVILIVLATIIFLTAIFLTVGGPKGTALLIMGPSGSGKTALFLQLRDGSTHLGTVPSMEPNEDTVILSQGGSQTSAVVVDIPGHPRVRHRFEGYISKARGVIFMLDSVDFSSNKAEAADALYELLTQPVTLRRRLPILLACNKADAGEKAFSADFIRKRLEKDIEALRITRRSLADSTGNGEKDVLSCAGTPFTFEGLARGRGPIVSAAPISVSTGDLSPVLSFARKLF
eukprot:jgi/Botrbrau1/10772/Bobra.0119s0002.1